MKTSIDAVIRLEKKITVEIPAEDVSKRIEEQFAEIRKEVPAEGIPQGEGADGDGEALLQGIRRGRPFRADREGVAERRGEGKGHQDPFPGRRGRRQGGCRAGLQVLRHGGSGPRGRGEGLQGDPRDPGEGERDRRGRRVGDRAPPDPLRPVPARGRAQGRARRPGGVRLQGGLGRRDGGREREDVDRPLQRHPVRAGVRGQDDGGRRGRRALLRDRLPGRSPGPEVRREDGELRREGRRPSGRGSFPTSTTSSRSSSGRGRRGGAADEDAAEARGGGREQDPAGGGGAAPAGSCTTGTPSTSPRRW